MEDSNRGALVVRQIVRREKDHQPPSLASVFHRLFALSPTTTHEGEEEQNNIVDLLGGVIWKLRSMGKNEGGREGVDLSTIICK